jgi:hypothetical protein
LHFCRSTQAVLKQGPTNRKSLYHFTTFRPLGVTSIRFYCMELHYTDGLTAVKQVPICVLESPRTTLSVNWTTSHSELTLLTQRQTFCAFFVSGSRARALGTTARSSFSPLAARYEQCSLVTMERTPPLAMLSNRWPAVSLSPVPALECRRQITDADYTKHPTRELRFVMSKVE